MFPSRLTVTILPCIVTVLYAQADFHGLPASRAACSIAATRKRQVRCSARPREYLTEREIEKLMDAAAGNRWGHRDATAILLAYRHGLRASELVALRWDDVDFRTGKLHVRRSKGGQHYLGHRSIASTVRYTALAPDRFKDFWKD